MMRVVILNFFYEAWFESPADLLAHYVNLTGWTEGVAGAGATVTVMQRAAQAATVERNGVTYHFIPDRFGPTIRAWQQPGTLYGCVRQICRDSLRDGVPTVVHLNGLLFPLHTRLLRWLMPRRCPLILQHHAERPWPARTRPMQRWGLGAADAFLFTNEALAGEWRVWGGLPPSARVHEIMETSTPFTYQPRAEARAKTGLTGEPLILWTGSLSRRKDPLTVLAGLAPIFAERPTARFYMAYLEDELLPQVQAAIEGDPALRDKVTLLGRLPHAEIEAYYNSADFFVQGSHSEGSGIAVLDALACGVVPVITDIPSFRTLTGDGQVGALWPVGQAEALTGALRGLLTRPHENLSRRARDFFNRHWHFSGLGQRAVSIYETVWEDDDD